MAKQTLRVGQVWVNKNKESFTSKVCIGAINEELRKVWINGVIDQVDPIWTWEYLDNNYELEAGWMI